MNRIGPVLLFAVAVQVFCRFRGSLLSMMASVELFLR